MCNNISIKCKNRLKHTDAGWEPLLKGKGKDSLLLKGLFWQSPCSFSDFMFFSLLSLLQKSLSRVMKLNKESKEVKKWQSKEGACLAHVRNS